MTGTSANTNEQSVRVDVPVIIAGTMERAPATGSPEQTFR